MKVIGEHVGLIGIGASRRSLGEHSNDVSSGVFVGSQAWPVFDTAKPLAWKVRDDLVQPSIRVDLDDLALQAIGLQGGVQGTVEELR